MKLTGAQLRALAVLAEFPAYKPRDAPEGLHLRELAKLGAATKIGARLYTITDAGRAALPPAGGDPAVREKARNRLHELLRADPAVREKARNRLHELLRATESRCQQARTISVEGSPGEVTEAVATLVHDALMNLVEAEILAKLLPRKAGE